MVNGESGERSVLTTRFPLPTLPRAGYSVKLIYYDLNDNKYPAKQFITLLINRPHFRLKNKNIKYLIFFSYLSRR